MIDTTRHFGQWLRRMVEETGVSRRAFADAHGISFDSLNRWIGQPRPGLYGYNAARLARALGVTRETIEAKLSEAEETHQHEAGAAA